MAIKPSLFQTGGGEDLAVKDAYAKSDLEVRADEAVSGKLGGGIGKGLSTMLGKQEAPISNMATNMVSRSGVDSGRIGASLGGLGLSETTERAIIDHMDGEVDSSGNPTTDNESKTKLIKTIVKGKFKDIKTLMDDTNFKSADSLITLMNGLSDTPMAELLDLESKFAMLATIMEEAKKLGITDILEDLIASIDDTKATKKWLSDNLVAFFDNGDVESITMAMDWLGPSTVISRVPDGIKRLLRSFVRAPISRDHSDPAGALRKQWDGLKKCLYRLDKQWSTTMWQGERIVNLEPFFYASPEVLLVSEQDLDYYRKFVLAKEFYIVGVKVWASRNHQYLDLKVVS